MTAIELYAPQGAEMVSGMIYAPDEQGCCDTSCKSAIKMPSLLLYDWGDGRVRTRDLPTRLINWDEGGLDFKLV